MPVRNRPAQKAPVALRGGARLPPKTRARAFARRGKPGSQPGMGGQLKCFRSNIQTFIDKLSPALELAES